MSIHSLPFYVFFFRAFSSLSIALSVSLTSCHSQAALVADFRALREQFEAEGLFRSNPLFYILHIGHIMLLDALCVLLLWQWGNGWINTILCIVLMSIAQVGGAYNSTLT